MRIAIDTNVLIDLEQDAERSRVLCTLVSSQPPPGVSICVPAIIASERGRGGVLIDHFDQFQSRLDALGLGGVELLHPMLYLDVSFLDQALLCDRTMGTLERKIHDVLFPELEFEYSKYCADLGIDPTAKPTARRWRNAKCDVQIAWSHVWHKTDMLVSSDSNFHKPTKKAELEKLADGRPIVMPSDLPSLLARPAV